MNLRTLKFGEILLVNGYYNTHKFCLLRRDGNYYGKCNGSVYSLHYAYGMCSWLHAPHLQTALPKVVLHRRKQLVMSVCKPEAICIIICTTYIYSILAMKITQYLRRQINISWLKFMMNITQQWAIASNRIRSVRAVASMRQTEALASVIFFVFSAIFSFNTLNT